ncbi:serine hydrolase domain-containing protein [uncultured Allomuricauda sp.]|uniref:serine hydrolase domain-containing protein n=1 Tax=Flagellimonas sp. W118 TaxID=3410791 RepID=UPI002633D98C|nr:serine hydrolase domain-containing protein [uncultured Allomuricauda sp.]
MIQKTLLALLSIAGIFIANGQEKDDLSKVISTLCDSLLAKKEIRSLSVGVIKSDKIYKFHKGRLINRKSPGDNTLYEMASLTKTFTGTLLAKAILDKKVGLDEDIRKYLPDSLPNLEFDGKPISFRHLVTHTSGLPNMFPNIPEIFDKPDWNELPFKINKLQEGYTRSQFLEALQGIKLDTVPGFKLSYSNAGANLLGYCLEKIYNKSYKDLIKAFILQPLRMNNTYVGVSDSKSKSVAKGLNSNGLEMPIRVRKELNAEGGIVSSLDDMMKYIQFHLQNDNAIIRISHQELLNGKYGDFENGLFWQIIKNGPKPDKVFQNGGAFGTSSWITLVPESELGVFIITNVSGPEVHQKLNATADKIIELF